MKKFVCLCVMKSGSHLLRHVWGIEGCPSFRRFSDGHLGVDMDGWEDSKYIMGHVGRSEEAEEMLHDRELWLLIRDPRDCIVSMWYWQQKKGLLNPWEWCIEEIGKQGRGIVRWEDYEGVKLLRYEDMILRPESTGLGIEKLRYRGGITYREGGGIGSYKKDFPIDLWGLYEQECKDIRHWEHNAVS